MTEMNYEETLVILNVSPDLEETVVDWLLGREGGTGFTSFTVFGHSTRHDELSPAEQVSGRQRRLQFQVQINRDAVDTFLSDARKTLDNTSVSFSLLPVLSTGHLREL